MSSTRIIHLSDLHLSPGPFDNSPLDQLIEKLAKIRERDAVDYHLVVMTGDLVDRGAGDYAPVGEFLDRLCSKLGIAKSSIFMVPGNHDVVRSRCGGLWQHVMQTLKNDPDTFDTMPLEERRVFWGAFERYTAFAARYSLLEEASKISGTTFPRRMRAGSSRPVGQSHFPDVLPVGELVPGFERASISLNGVQIRLVGINSALVAGSPDDSIAPAVPQDRIFGRKYLQASLVPGDQTLNIVASHYPVSCSHIGERDQVRHLLNLRDAILLTGHSHTATEEAGGAGEHHSLELGAGLALGRHWDGNQHCRILELDRVSRKILAHDLVWQPSHGGWRAIEPMSLEFARWEAICGAAQTPTAPTTAALGKRVAEVGLVDIRNNRTPAERADGFQRVLDAVSDDSELIIVGRSLIDWSVHDASIRELINKRGVHVKLGLLSPQPQYDRDCVAVGSCSASWIERPIERDWAIEDLHASMPRFQDIDVVAEAKGTLEIYGLPFYVSHSFVAYTDKSTGQRHCIEEVGMAQVKEGRPCIEVQSRVEDGPGSHDHMYAKALESMYRGMLSPDRLVTRKSSCGTQRASTSAGRVSPGCRFEPWGLHDIHFDHRHLNTPGPKLFDVLAGGYESAEVLIVGRSLVMLTQERRLRAVAEAVRNRGLKCSFVIADPTRPDVASLVEDYATADVVTRTWPELRAVFGTPEFAKTSPSGGFVEVYGIRSYVPETYCSVFTPRPEYKYCVIEPGIGVQPMERPKLCFKAIPGATDGVFSKTERIYRDILSHCRATQKPLLGATIEADPAYVERLVEGAKQWRRRLGELEQERVVSGDADVTGGERGWFIGHYLDPTCGLRREGNVEIKWGQHEAGQARTDASKSEVATTLTLLIDGEFKLDFEKPEKTVTLSKRGQYVIYAPGVLHKWQALSKCIVVTVRWPSVPEIA